MSTNQSPDMFTAYLLLGSNLGNREGYISTAVRLIENQCGKVVKQSSYYETAAWGNTNQPSFYNQVLVLKTTILPIPLMQLLLAIELEIGRERKEKYGARIIDIDMLLVDQLVIDHPVLKLPHPLLTERRFALMPLAEVAPHLQHPLAQKKILELLVLCTDTLNVEKIIL